MCRNTWWYLCVEILDGEEYWMERLFSQWHLVRGQEAKGHLLK